MTSFEPQPPAEKKKKRTDLVSKVWTFIQNRRTARTISQHGQALAALTAVTAAGVAGYGVIEAKQAQHQIGDLRAQVDTLRTDTLLAVGQIAALRANVDKLERKSAKQLHQLRTDLNRAGLTVDRLAMQLAALPPAPDLAPIAARVSKLAAATSEATRLANAATAAAADQQDDEARRQAELANEAAGSAAAAAREAQRAAREALSRALASADTATEARVVADAAAAAAAASGLKADQALADAAEAKATALAYDPFPRVITLPDFTDPPGAVGQNRTFTVDLPRGSYRAVLTMRGEGVQPWYVDMSVPGVAAPRANGVGNLDVTTELTLTTGGGTTTFTVRRDGFNPNSPATFINTTITIERN